MHSRAALSTGCRIALIGFVLGIAGVAWAADAPGAQTIQFHIEPQPLASALNAFALQSHQQILFTPEVTKGKTTQGTHGALTADEALERLLAGTGLFSSKTADGMVMVSRADAKGASAVRDPLRAPDGAINNQTANTQSVAAQNQAPISLDEVVVTAQKRTERLQDVPLSVSAVSGAEIAAKGVTSLEDLQYSIPGLSMASFGPGQENIQVRGVAGILGRPTTGQYLDELSVSGDDSNNTLHVSLLDMERLEVLRGPQATLYGEGSMGGTIRYITTPPDLSGVSGLVETDGGKVSEGAASYRGALVANLPLITDKVGLRLVGGYEREGGWIDNSSTGRSDVNGTSDMTIRAALRALPAEHLEVSLLFLHQQNDQDDGNFGINHVSTATVPTYDRDIYNLGAATLRYDFGAVSLVEAAGYIDHNTREQFDFTPYLQPILVANLGVAPADVSQIFNPESEWTRSFSNELRLASNGDGGFHWIVGAFYRTSHMQQTNVVSTAPTTLPFQILDTPASLRSHSYSLYAEGTYKLTDKLTALAGVRFYHDTERIDSDQVSFGAPISDHDRASFHSTNPRFNVRYEFSAQSMLYLNATEGFRSGGFNIGTPPGPTTFAPDHIWTYEVGTKQQLLERRLEFDGALYYSDWSSVQSAFFPPGTAGIVVTENAGKATGWGTDVSLAARPLGGLKLMATFGWNSLEFKTSTADKNAGDPVDYAPRKSYSLSLDYRRAIAGTTEGFLRADYQYSGRAQVTLRDFAQIVALPAHDTLNIRLGLDWRSFEASLYGTNILNDSTPIQIGPYGAIAENVEQRPRTLGVNVRLHF